MSTMPSGHDRHHGGNPLWAIPGAALLILLAGGCRNLDDIDRDVERLVEHRTALIGAEDTSPGLRSPDSDSDPRPDQADKTPPTNNPAPEELNFEQASPDRDVVGRLDKYSAVPGDARHMSLVESFHQAQESSREVINAEEEYILTAIRVLIQRHRWGPRFFDDVTASIDSPSSTGTRRAALNVINDLRVTQRLPYGGDVQAELITRATDQLTGIVGDRSTDATELALAANIPLLRNAGLIAQEDIIQAERDLIYSARTFEQFRRDFLVQIARDYLSLVAAQNAIRNQLERIRSLELFYEQQKALVQAGRVPGFEARNVQQNLLTSHNDLANSREIYILALDRFKIRLGIPVDVPIVIEPVSIELPEPEISVAKAAALALENRLDYQTQRDRVNDARRLVANARNQLLPDLNTRLATSFRTDPTDIHPALSMDLDQTVYSAAVTFGLPLDREEERLNVRAATLALQRQARELSLARDSIVLSARQSVREIDRARLSLTLQEQAVTQNELRLEQVRIDADRTDPQKRLDAENDLLEARNRRDAAFRDLQIAILEYLLATGQLRVNREGEFQDIPGVVFRQVAETGVPQPGAVGNVPAGAEPPFVPPGQQPAGPPNPGAPAAEPGREPPPVEDRPAPPR